MKRHKLVLPVIAIVAAVAVLFSACRKINDYTDVGGDLIPPIDNINTFDTSLSVQVFNDTFGLTTDSLRIINEDVHYLGLINNDPIFGKTDGRIFLELKPDFYGSYPFARKDSLKLDSVVLVMGYYDRYGDSLTAQTINVYELTQAFKTDSAYLIRKEPLSYGVTQLNLPGQLTFPYKLDDSIKAFQDTTAAQLRIKLDTALVGRRLMNYDTSNAYRSDSAFRSLFKGFAVKSEAGGNAVMGFTITAGTKLAFYYKIPKKSGTFDSTVVSYFNFHSDCNSANYVKRDHSGTQVAALAGSAIPASIGYVQKTPGSFVSVIIPDLPGLSNRVVHRAELVVEQLYNSSDAMFPPPANMYLDAYDPTITSSYKFRTIPYSQDLSPNSGFDFTGFGVAPVNATDPVGNPIKVWKFNMSRYVQHIVNGKQTTSYQLRLHAPLTIQGKTKAIGSTTDFDVYAGAYVNTTTTTGRIRVAGGTPGPQRMRLRIVFSKL